MKDEVLNKKFQARCVIQRRCSYNKMSHAFVRIVCNNDLLHGQSTSISKMLLLQFRRATSAYPLIILRLKCVEDWTSEANLLDLWVHMCYVCVVKWKWCVYVMILILSRSS